MQNEILNLTKIAMDKLWIFTDTLPCNVTLLRPRGSASYCISHSHHRRTNKNVHFHTHTKILHLCLPCIDVDESKYCMRAIYMIMNLICSWIYICRKSCHIHRTRNSSSANSRWPEYLIWTLSVKFDILIYTWELIHTTSSFSLKSRQLYMILLHPPARVP